MTSHKESKLQTQANFYLYVSVTRVSPKNSLRILNHLPHFFSFFTFLSMW